jgi:predicted permease
MGTFFHHARHAVRGLMRTPGFTAIAILTLGLGIGANTAIFSVVHGVLLKPLPFEHPEQLVALNHCSPPLDICGMNNGPATYFTYRNNSQAFQEIGAWESNQASITGRDEPEQVEVLSVTGETLPLLGVAPLVGRLFAAEEDAPGSPLRALLTYGYWQRRFAGARDVVGQTVHVDGRIAEVIGVLPSTFKFLRTDAAMLLPMQLNPADAADPEFDFQIVARLRPGTSLDRANADLARMISLLPASFGVLKLRPDVRPLTAEVVGNVGEVLWILFAAVGIVMLIACANATNLFLVRAERRQQELAVRAALGASRGRIAIELLSQSLMLGLGGCAVGLVLAQAAIGVLRTLAPAELPRVDEIALDPVVVLFAVVISVVAGILFGIIPTLRFGAPDAGALKEGGRSATDSPGRHRTSGTLVVTEVALAVMLLIVSGLMIRTFVAMRQVHPGFVGPEQVQTFRVAIPEEVIADDLQFARTHEQIVQRLEGVPGVTSVGLSSSITMDGEDNGNPLYVEHVDLIQGQLPPLRRFKTAGPRYFETMGNPIVAGRPISWIDIYQRRRVVVISENLAREYWKDPSVALGKRVRYSPNVDWYEVVGVVGNEHDDGLSRPATAIVYWPLAGDYTRRAIAYAVRSTRVGSPGFIRELQQAVWSVNPNLPLAAAQTLTDIRAASMAQTSFAMVMLAIAASVALLLGVVGIYGVIAYTVEQRTREIGARIALGAEAGDVCRLFLRRGLALTATGVVLGMTAASLTTGAMSALLFGVRPVDPATYVIAGACLTAVAMLATYLPARRAARMDPLTALRYE